MTREDFDKTAFKDLDCKVLLTYGTLQSKGAQSADESGKIEESPGHNSSQYLYLAVKATLYAALARVALVLTKLFGYLLHNNLQETVLEAEGGGSFKIHIHHRCMLPLNYLFFPNPNFTDG